MLLYRLNLFFFGLNFYAQLLSPAVEKHALTLAVQRLSAFATLSNAPISYALPLYHTYICTQKFIYIQHLIPKRLAKLPKNEQRPVISRH